MFYSRFGEFLEVKPFSNSKRITTFRRLYLWKIIKVENTTTRDTTSRILAKNARSKPRSSFEIGLTKIKYKSVYNDGLSEETTGWLIKGRLNKGVLCNRVELEELIIAGNILKNNVAFIKEQDTLTSLLPIFFVNIP